MKVKRQALEAGDVLIEDIYGKTQRPIMRKETVLEKQHLEVLEAFFIDEVPIDPKRVDKENASGKNEPDQRPNSSFVESYLRVVEQFKDCFRNWQSGEKINIHELRGFLIPLLEEAVEQRDDIFSLHYYVPQSDYLYHHAVSTAALAAFLAKEMSYSKGDWLQIGLAGALCDCGMAKVSLSFLKNKGTPSVREQEEIRQHPVYSYQMLKLIPALQEGVRLAASQHHEREDGSGYPLSIRGEQMHPFSKIVAVADSFHAMTCERPYREKFSPFQAIDIMKEEQFGCYSLVVLETLSKAVLRLSVGTKVRLTNHQLGEIIFIHPHKPTKPLVRLDQNGEIIALAERSDLAIDTILT
ncbi:MAG TPA: HD-GYP domain-containing protein [Bacillales bacterium]|nr:HD-GYP domain-containing protein [Bacillales bacterium]